MAAESPTCHEAERNLAGILSELRFREIVKTPYQDMVAGAFKKCPSCRKSRRRRNKCLGWHLRLEGRTAIEFRDFEVNGRRVFARVEGVFSTERSDSDRSLDGWRLQPCSISTCAIDVRILSNKKSVERHHHDLANPAQPGPVWHLQLGGARARDRWLDIPRWPMAPMDPVLVIELAVYSFFNDTWKDLRSSNPWRTIIKRTEALLLPHYHDRLHKYLTQGTGIDSWLAHQCNIEGDWNLRPAQL